MSHKRLLAMGRFSRTCGIKRHNLPALRCGGTCLSLAIYIFQSSSRTVNLANHEVARRFRTDAYKQNGSAFTKPDGTADYYYVDFVSDFYDAAMPNC